MRTLVLEAARKLAWHDVAEPVRQSERDAIVRPLAVALCDLDQPMILGQAPIAGATPLGHECVAEVVEGGGGFQTGEVVVVPYQISCGTCDSCNRGRTGDCTNVPSHSMYGFGSLGGDWGGMLSDLVRVPYADSMLVRVPAGVDPATVACASDNLTDAWRCVAPGLAEWPGAEVLVLGGGAPSIGLYAIDVALALGAAAVTYVDIAADTGRLAVASGLGAQTIDGPPPRKLGPFPITVDASGSREGLHAALRSTRRGGRCTSTGIIFEAETPLPLFEMFNSGVTLHIGRTMARPVIPVLLELVAAGRIHPEKVTSAVVPWTEAEQALLEPQTKLVVRR